MGEVHVVGSARLTVTARLMVEPLGLAGSNGTATCRHVTVAGVLAGHAAGVGVGAGGGAVVVGATVVGAAVVALDDVTSVAAGVVAAVVVTAAVVVGAGVAPGADVGGNVDVVTVGGSDDVELDEQPLASASTATTARP